MSHICPVCGYENRPGNRFCTRCGEKLRKPETSSPELVVLGEEEYLQTFTLYQLPGTIGRNAENTVTVNDDQMSRRHAAILQQGDQYWIEDLNSKNGVFVNGVKISEREQLNDGCLIKLGSTIFRFDIPESLRQDP